MLDSSRTQGFTYPAQGSRPGVAVFAGDADLDQFMRVEAAVNFLEHRRREPAIADQNHRVEDVGAGLEHAVLARGQWICQEFLQKSRL